MSVKSALNERHQHILRATIQHYIATAEPVGSKALAEEYDLCVSSATIRNALGQLEKAGLLYQPHTSAGRIPSDWGYRIYVDRLINPDLIQGEKLKKSLTKELNWDKWSFEAILQRATQILAALSGYIALATMPQNSNNRLRHLQLVSVDAKQVMLIIVTDSFQTRSVLLEQRGTDPEENRESEELAEHELQILSNFLNSKLRGRSLLEISSLDWSELDREFKCHADFLKTLLKELSARSEVSINAPIMIRGISELLRQPEFSQLRQAQALLRLLEEEQERLFPLMFELPEPETVAKRVSIWIGSENPLEQMRPCTMISAVYKQKDIPLGSVAVIGPTRMLYENAIALVESTAEYLSDTLS